MPRAPATRPVEPGLNRLLKNDAAHGLTVSAPNRDKLTMRINSLKTLDLILSLSKDEARLSGFFSSLLRSPPGRRNHI